MSLRLQLEYWQDGDRLIGRLPQIPGLFSQAGSVEELDRRIREAFEQMAEAHSTLERVQELQYKEIEVSMPVSPEMMLRLIDQSQSMQPQPEFVMSLRNLICRKLGSNAEEDMPRPAAGLSEAEFAQELGQLISHQLGVRVVQPSDSGMDLADTSNKS